MKKDYYNDFFARPYENRYPYRKPYENFTEIPAFPIINDQESFFPVIKESTLSNNDKRKFRIYNNFKMNYNSDIYDAVDYEDDFSFQYRKNFNSPKIGPSIRAMPTIIDFDEED